MPHHRLSCLRRTLLDRYAAGAIDGPSPGSARTRTGHRRPCRRFTLRDTIVFLTCVHELGHAIGLTHTDNFRDIMYSFQYGGDFVEYFERYRRLLKSRADIPALSVPAADEIARLRSLYDARQ